MGRGRFRPSGPTQKLRRSLSLKMHTANIGRTIKQDRTSSVRRRKVMKGEVHLHYSASEETWCRPPQRRSWVGGGGSSYLIRGVLIQELISLVNREEENLNNSYSLLSDHSLHLHLWFQMKLICITSSLTSHTSSGEVHLIILTTDDRETNH